MFPNICRTVRSQICTDSLSDGWELGFRTGLRRRSGQLIAACAALMLSACTSPGMKLDVKAGAQATNATVDGISIRLQSLNAEVLRAQASRSPEVQSIADLVSDKLPPYRVGPQDVLLVTVWDHPEITLPLGQYRSDVATGQVVDEDGSLFFPYVGRVQVKDLTTAQVREKLTTELAKVLQRPQVDVKVIAYRSQKVYVGGEVKNPGVYNVTDVPFTLSEAVNRAGGFLPSADDSRLILTRGDRTWRLDFQGLMTKGNRIGQILLKEGDSLQVPNSKDAPVYMMGELMRPGSMPLIHGNLSLAQAISEAGGIQGVSADARSIYVIRQASGANIDVFHLDARNPASMVMADRFALNPRDIVYVDAGTLVRFSRVMNMLLPTVSAVTSTALTGANIKYLLDPKLR